MSDVCRPTIAFRLTIAVIAAALPWMSLPAMAAPNQLYGKSISIVWQEDRVQERVGEGQSESVQALGEMKVYVSEQGRPFSRLTMGRVNRRGKFRSANADAVDGVGNRPDQRSFVRDVRFSGHTMAVIQHRGPDGAVQVLATFDDGFQSCTARVTIGKSPGAQAMRVRSLISGRAIIIHSAKTSGESCRIQNGNVFAN